MGIFGACLVKSTGFIRDNELQALNDVVKRTGPASQAALDNASAVSSLIPARRQTDMDLGCRAWGPRLWAVGPIG